MELERWAIVEKEITKLKLSLERSPGQRFTSQDRARICLTILDICRDRNNIQYVYHRYRQTIEEYIAYTVLPSLAQAHGVFLLKVLVKTWKAYKTMVRELSLLFGCLDLSFLPENHLPSLRDFSLTCFRDVVYQNMGLKARDAAIDLMEQAREGGQVDAVLLEQVSNVFIENGWLDDDLKNHILILLFRSPSSSVPENLASLNTTVSRSFLVFYKFLNFAENVEICVGKRVLPVLILVSLLVLWTCETWIMV